MNITRARRFSRVPGNVGPLSHRPKIVSFSCIVRHGYSVHRVLFFRCLMISAISYVYVFDFYKSLKYSILYVINYRASSVASSVVLPSRKGKK